MKMMLRLVGGSRFTHDGLSDRAQQSTLTFFSFTNIQQGNMVSFHNTMVIGHRVNCHDFVCLA